MQNNNTNQKGTMTRIRLNQEYRNKIANRMRVHLEQEDTQEKQKYDTLKASNPVSYTHLRAHGPY